MNGIEPFFEAYESPVLPLNYIGRKAPPWRQSFLVAGGRFARPSQGYEPRELLLLYPAPYIISHFALKNKAG